MEPPVRPDESDCCNSGCNPCILDVYEIQLQKYQEYIKNENNQQTLVINSVTPISYTTFKLAERIQISSTVFLLKFVYADLKDQTPDHFKCSPGHYLLLRGRDHEGEFTRAYTPIPVGLDPHLGFTILAKIYEVGRMSKLLKKLQVGQKTSWRGPYGDYHVNDKYKFLFFVAQGTGIAPIFAVLKQIVNDESCESFIKLFFCCRDCDNILLRNELYELGMFWNFSYEIFLSNSNGLVSKFNEAIHEDKLSAADLSRYIDGKKGQLQVVICGSENFNRQIKNEIEQFDIQSTHIYLF